MVRIKKENLSSQVYAALKEMIADYRFKPGSRLNVEKLAKDFGVSRTPVWEAVRRLEQEGLVENIPNRGVFMVEMTPQMALDIYQVREVLEGLAARLAVNCGDGKKLERLEKILDAQGEVVENEDLVAFSRLSSEFHGLIHRMGGNELLQDMIESLTTKMKPTVKLSKSKLMRLYQDHADLVQALKSCDRKRAEEIMREHNRSMQIEIEKEWEKVPGKMTGGKEKAYPHF